jgi:hypothetical protein
VGFYLFWGEMASTKPQTTAWLGVRVLGRMPPSFALGFNNLKDLPKKTQREARKKGRTSFSCSTQFTLTFFSYIWSYLKMLKFYIFCYDLLYH